MGQLLTKPGVVYFDPIPPAGQAILDALKAVAATLSFDLTVTSAADGVHSGPSDPHHTGNAYDVRSHDIASPDKGNVLYAVMQALASHGERPLQESGGLIVQYFFGWIEALGQANEHYHFQLRHGVQYP
jgi:hypothetical protein